MRKLIVCAAMALTLGMAGLAQAGCTAEEAKQDVDALCAFYDKAIAKLK